MNKRKKHRRHRFIETLEDLHYEKKLLREEIEESEDRLEAKFQQLRSSVSVESILQLIIGEKQGIKADVITHLVPFILKYRGEILQSRAFGYIKRIPKKYLVFIALGGLVAHLVTRTTHKHRTHDEVNHTKNRI